MAPNRLRVVISLVLMALLLAFLLWNVDLERVVDALGQADPRLIGASIAFALATYWFRAVRWQLILRPVGRTRHTSALLATAVGYAAMSLPARMGDLVRPLVLARRDRLPLSAALATILTERIFDLWTVVVYFLVFVVWPPRMISLDAQASGHFAALRLTGYAVGVGLVVGSLMLIGLFRYQERFVALATGPVRRLRPNWASPVETFLGHFLDGLRVLERPRDLALTLAASLALWYGIAWQVHCCLKAFHFEGPLRVSYFLLTMAVLGLTIPTPAGVGGFHKATQVGLTTFFGVELNRAIAIAIAYHAISFVPITLIGLLCLPFVDLRLRELGRMTGASAPPSDHVSEARHS